MSWGTDFKADIFISRQVFNSVGLIEDTIDAYDNTIKEIESKIKMFAAATPAE